MNAKVVIAAAALCLWVATAFAQDGRRPLPRTDDAKDAHRYSLEQACSDKAQLNTIAFDGLAFLTGDFAACTFLPPGKVSDYFGFQYMRDIDAGEKGHNTDFLTRVASNVLYILNDEQKARLIALAKEQVGTIDELARARWPLIRAFVRQRDGDIPKGSAGLDRAAVMDYSAAIFAIDGELAFRRAQVVGAIVRSLDDKQKAYLAKMKFGDCRTWPDIPEQIDKRSMTHEEHVAVMTYASEMFSWYAGSVDADVYFCPERHGTYFGSFYMKDAPAMGHRDYSISTSLTGDSGEAFLAALTAPQRKLITDIVDLQRRDLQEIVKLRRSVATELRKFLTGDDANKETVMTLSKRYGELDGEMSWLYATHFAEVAKTLSADQKKTLMKLRNLDGFVPKGAFVYSTPVDNPGIPDTVFLFRQAAK